MSKSTGATTSSIQRNDEIADAVRAYFGLRDDATPEQVMKALQDMVTRAAVLDRKRREAPVFTVIKAEATEMVRADFPEGKLRATPYNVVTLTCQAQVGAEGLSIPVGGKVKLLLDAPGEK